MRQQFYSAPEHGRDRSDCRCRDRDGMALRRSPVSETPLVDETVFDMVPAVDRNALPGPPRGDASGTLQNPLDLGGPVSFPAPGRVCELKEPSPPDPRWLFESGALAPI